MMIWWPLQALVIFAASTTMFDAIHWALHKWAHSPFKLLRIFASWHQVHHRFLDRGMRVHKSLTKANFWAHLVPEFITTQIGTLAFLLIMPWQPVAYIVAVHCWFFLKHFYDEGVDVNHMAMDRVPGNRGVIRVDPAYHAMHHIQPSAFYSSYINIFDLIFGTALKLDRQRVTILGTGSLARAMAVQLSKEGATVRLIGREGISDYSWMESTDILVLAVGSRKMDGMLANFSLPVTIAEAFIEQAKDRLVPPEVWGIGSETEMFGGGLYAETKQEFAKYAARYWAKNPNVTYRHIVPSAFRSKLNGWAPMGANTVARIAIFLLKRGFMYVPVTMTGLAILNRILFEMRKRGDRHVEKYV